MAEEGDAVVVLVDNEGKESEFKYLDTVEMDDKEYVVLLPIEQDEKDDDTEEVLILRVDHNENGEDIFSSVDNDEELNSVFEKFKLQVENQFEFAEE